MSWPPEYPELGWRNGKQIRQVFLEGRASARLGGDWPYQSEIFKDVWLRGIESVLFAADVELADVRNVAAHSDEL